MKFNEILSGMIGFLAVVLMSGEATTLVGQAVLFLISGGLMLIAWLLWKLPRKEDLNGKES